MAPQVTYSNIQNRQKLKSIFAVCLVLFIAANVVIDYLSTLFQNSLFYISESLLFSSYWVLFFPLLTLLLKPMQKVKLTLKLLFISLVIIVHLLLYPALVWILSKGFYSHTFSYWQTFHFGLSAYLIKTVIIYGFLFTVNVIANQKNQAIQIAEEDEIKSNINSILISDSNNRKSVIAVNDIFYFSANSPYVDIYHLSKKHLHSETLKSLETQLDSAQFVRIHKSHIVNISKISSVQSRYNGDYDITLTNNIVLRMSRNYVKNFKLQFLERHQLTLK